MMVALKSIVLSILLMMSGSENKDDLSLVGCTPADTGIRKTFNIRADIPVDFIRWELHLKDNKFELELDYGESQPNTMGFKPDSIKTKLTGEYSVSKSQNYNSEIFTLHSEQLGNDLLLLKINNNIYQVLESDLSLMTGNGGWSYTLNNINLQMNDLTSIHFLPPGTGTNQLIYDGRTPCQEFSAAYKFVVPPGCFKLKWRLILNFDPITHLPTTYNFRHYDSAGKWVITKGTPKNPEAIIYTLSPDNPNRSISFLRANDNILYFLDKNLEPLVGNKDFSYTLNQIRD